MDNFTMFYKILSALEKAMDYEIFDTKCISPEKLKISEERWKKYILILAEEGFIKGVKINKDVTDGINVNIDDIRITFKGLDYLQNNSAMVKIYKAIKGTKDLIS